MQDFPLKLNIIAKNTKITANDITNACSSLTVTAKAEHIPRICLVIGLLSIKGSKNVFLLIYYS